MLYRIVEAVKDVLPHVEHRQYASLIYANLGKTYPGVVLKKLFCLPTKYIVEVQFIEHMNVIKAIRYAMLTFFFVCFICIIFFVSLIL